MTEREWLASDDPAAMLHWASGRDGSPPIHGYGDRKLRLFACACCRICWRLLADTRSRRAVEVSERFADGEATAEELQHAEIDVVYAASSSDSVAWVRGLPCNACELTVNCPQMVQRAARGGIQPATQAALLRDIIGNPFRPVRVADDLDDFAGIHQGLTRRHLVPTVVALAEAAYTERPERKCKQCCDGQQMIKEWREGLGICGIGQKACGYCHGTGTIADGRLDPVRLAVLADALEDAGCDREELLRHLRGEELCPRCEGTKVYDDIAGEDLDGRGGYLCTVACEECSGGWRSLRGPHVRGCWVLDLLLGKE